MHEFIHELFSTTKLHESFTKEYLFQVSHLLNFLEFRSLGDWEFRQ